MSSVTVQRQTLLEIRQFLSHSPSPDNHKGSSGRIAVVGGSSCYAGAPFFSAMAALRSGADLSYVFTTHEACPVIKGYSPDLIVIPCLDSSLKKCEKIFEQHLSKCHAMIIGPGLGRDLSDEFFLLALKTAHQRNIPIIIDADALFYFCKNIGMLADIKSTILTPNMHEILDLYSAATSKSIDAKSFTKNPMPLLQEIVKNIPGLTIFCKGPRDLIIDSSGIFVDNDTQGSPCRVGGQGDILCGVLSTHLFEAKLKTESSGSIKIGNQQFSAEIASSLVTSYLMRLTNKHTYDKLGKSMVASDMLSSLAEVLNSD